MDIDALKEKAFFKGSHIFSAKGARTFNNLCHLNILPSKDGKVMVILTKVKASNSCIIKDFAELATMIYKHYLSGVSTNEIVWIANDSENNTQQDKDREMNFYEVSLSWEEKPQCFKSAKWRPCAPELLPSILMALEGK